MSALAKDLLLAIDTSTSIAVVALGDMDGRPLVEDSWTAGFRHGEELLARIDRLLRERALRIDAVSAIAVGTGPGAFTGLRVGLATAKGLALALGRPIVAISSGAGLLEAARDVGTPGPAALLLPAGPTDRILVDGSREAAAATRLPADAAPAIPLGTVLVAVDLDGRADGEAIRLGRLAQGRLGRALLRLGAARLAGHGPDDLAAVVPDYVTLPRGVEREVGEIVMGRV